MTWTGFVGSGLLGFGPPLALFITFLASRPPLIVLALGSSFFWLASVMIAALVWYVLYPWREFYFIVLPVAVLLQEAMRYAFYRLFMVARTGLQRGFTAAAAAARGRTARRAAAIAAREEQARARARARAQRARARAQVEGGEDAPGEPVELEKEGEGEGDLPLPVAVRAASTTPEGAHVLTPEEIRLSPEAALDNFSSALAIGLGFGLTAATVMYGSILVEGIGPGALFSPSCPSVNLFVYSGMICMAVTLMHVCLSIMAFDAYDARLPRPNKLLKTCIIVMAHLLISYFTILNQKGGHCVAALLLVYGVVSILIGFTSMLAVSSPALLAAYPAVLPASSNSAPQRAGFLSSLRN